MRGGEGPAVDDKRAEKSIPVVVAGAEKEISQKRRSLFSFVHVVCVLLSVSVWTCEVVYIIVGTAVGVETERGWGLGGLMSVFRSSCYIDLES